MDALLWILLPACVTVGSGLMVYIIMRSHMEAVLANEREIAAQARGQLEAQRLSMEERLIAADESAKRQALNELLCDIRVEERHYVRNRRVLFTNQRTIVFQERMFFRNIPLSNWVEHEIVVEEGVNMNDLLRNVGVFAPGLQALDPELQKPPTSLIAGRISSYSRQ